MGLDAHGYNFLKYCVNNSAMGNVATIGRQGIHLSNDALKSLGISNGDKGDRYIEQLLIGRFGATRVDSFDISDYENATFLHDFNNKISQDHAQKYDWILDLGTTEHIFNLPQAFENYRSMLSIGGRIVHVLPANNFNGHGFWQFSAELFFSLYNSSNGFGEVRIFFADLNKENIWYRAPRPHSGERTVFWSETETYILVFARKSANVSHPFYLQQSDYLSDWSQGLSSVDRIDILSSRLTSNFIKDALRNIPGLNLLIRRIGFLRRRSTMSLRNFSDKLKLEKN
jgi:hypothetical protein